MALVTIAELVKFHKTECNKYEHGSCNLRRCMNAAGYNRETNPKVDPTCLHHEAVKLLEELEKLVQE